MNVYIYIYINMCVCERERERERESKQLLTRLVKIVFKIFTQVFLLCFDGVTLVKVLSITNELQVYTKKHTHTHTNTNTHTHTHTQT